MENLSNSYQLVIPKKTDTRPIFPVVVEPCTSDADSTYFCIDKRSIQQFTKCLEYFTDFKKFLSSYFYKVA